MFRNPRENRNAPTTVAPSLGRPPSPSPLQSTHANAAPRATPPSKSGTLAETATPTPSVKLTPSRNGLAKQKQSNQSILSFFKKADKPEESLFVGNGSPVKSSKSPSLGRTNSLEEENDNAERYQELGDSVKRRKVSHEFRGEPEEADGVFEDRGCTPPPESVSNGANAGVHGQQGPFLDESDSEVDEEDKEEEETTPNTSDEGLDGIMHFTSESNDVRSDKHVDDKALDAARDSTPGKKTPDLRRASTSMPELGEEDFADFEGMQDFDDEYEEGEEFLNRRLMQEQGLDFEGAFEGELNDEDLEVGIEGTEPETPDAPIDVEAGAEPAAGDAVPSCPICSVSFEGVSDQEASVHVNHCLDGNPTPLPKTAQTNTPVQPSKPLELQKTSSINANTFKRPPRPAKPGQTTPLSLKNGGAHPSAFSRLMSGHSEESAFAEAAASEKKSFGKPNYQRTCPFYKILPGMATCVDAFRYGAVEGCSAYFLSHFHSDHYVGLSSSWSHGPIYCSGVTGRLCKQQLRVDPKYVVELEWEKPFSIPGTPGVTVTMIPANHCPGSSIYLFEQTIPSKTSAGKPRTQRVLHCGDFRACPAHVEHPLLMPDVRDKVSGKLREQKIDVCYLDTTYCSPKWAFPSQEDVIKACADICLTLNRDDVDADDKFAAMLRDKTGGGIAKFVRTSSSGSISNPSIIPDDPKAGLLDSSSPPEKASQGPLLVVVGTYSIGKERICLGIARALNSLIYAPPPKQRIVAALQDPELSARMTSDPTAAQVHMTPLFEIRPDTLADYLAGHGSRFKRAVAFRPSGWNFRSPASRGAEPAVNAILHSDAWKSRYSARDLAPQRGSTPKAACFGVPYSEHSSFRELSMFCCALRIDKVIPTVNVGSAIGRARMKGWVERWAAYRRKEGLFKVNDEEGKSTWFPGEGTWGLRTTL